MFDEMFAVFVCGGNSLGMRLSNIHQQLLLLHQASICNKYTTETAPRSYVASFPGLRPDWERGYLGGMSGNVPRLTSPCNLRLQFAIARCALAVYRQQWNVCATLASIFYR